MTATAALAGDGSIYCGGEDQQIHKLNGNGARTWSYALRSWMASSPAIGPDGRIYCCDGSGYTYCLNGDGTLGWEIGTDSTVFITSSPAVASDGMVYVGTEDGRLLALKDGSIIWSYEIEVTPKRGISSSPIIGPDGNIYFGCDDGKLYRINQNTHQPATNWPILITDSLRGLTSTPLLCADNIIYVADDFSLYAYDVNNPSGGPRWKSTLVPPGKGGAGRLSVDNQPSPVVDQYGIVYISTGNGIFAIAGRPGGILASSDWPMFHHDARHTGRFGAR